MVDIVIIEDNEEISELLKVFLDRAGYETYIIGSGEDAISFFKQDKAKLVLLDIMLPGMDGFAVLSEIREKNNIPVIIMSARTDKEDKMNGFMLGADDYIEKPVDVDILTAKVKALMNRNYNRRENPTILHSGALQVDLEAKQVTLNKQLLNLSIKEYELLLLLIQNSGKTLHKDYLFNEIWGADSFSENQTLTVHIKTLRDKIEEEPKKPKRIITVWGVGYRYEEI